MDGSPETTVDPVAILGLMRSFLNAVGNGTLPEHSVVGDEGNDLLQTSALEGPATVLFDAGGVPMLTAVATSAADAGAWRGAEVAVGVLANMACHASLRAKFLHDTDLVEFVTRQALPAEDAATAGEACRLCTTVLCSSTGSDPWYEALTSPDALKSLVWIIENSRNSSVVAHALGLPAVLLGAAETPPPALAERLVELQIVSMALSAIRSRLRELDEVADDGQPLQRPIGPVLATEASPEVLGGALAVLYQLGGTAAGVEALGREADAAAVTVRLAAAEGPESDAVAPCIMLLTQLEDKKVGKLLVDEAGAVDVVLSALSGTCPAGANADAQSVLRAAALHHLALILRQLNGSSEEEWEGLKGVASAVVSAVEALPPGDDSPTASHCLRAIDTLKPRLN